MDYTTGKWLIHFIKHHKGNNIFSVLFIKVSALQKWLQNQIISNHSYSSILY